MNYTASVVQPTHSPGHPIITRVAQKQVLKKTTTAKQVMEGSGAWLLSSDLAESGYGSYTENSSSRLSCLEIQHEVGIPLPVSVEVADVLRSFQIIYFLIILLLGVLMNTLVIVLVAKFKKLKTVTFYLALQVIVVDLLNAAILLPTSTANAIAKYNVFSHYCSILGVVVFFLRSVRTFIMTVLVIDRFCSVFMPFWYPKIRVKKLVTLSLFAWITALVLSVIPCSRFLDCYSFQQYTWTCTMSVGCTFQKACTIYNISTIIFMRVLNILAILLYLMLYFKARKLQNRIKDSSLQNLEARLERQRQEDRANLTFFLLFVALIGVSFPATFFNQAMNLQQVSTTILNVSKGVVFQFLTVVAQTLHSLLVIIDPVVILRDKDAKEVMMKCISKIKKSALPSSSQQTHTE